MENGFRILALACAFLVLALPTNHASAYWTGEDITESEFDAWPSFCKTGFLDSEFGARSRFRARLSQSARAATPNKAIPGGHHFCIGLVAINRSTSKSKDKAKDLMRTAANEIGYSYSRMSLENPDFSLVSAYYGKALYGMGERQKGFDVWSTAIRAQPSRRESYLLMTEALISERRLDEALRLLTDFDATKDQPWPDAEYWLGYVYYEKGKHEEALKHVEQAIALGYPSDGLRKKILNSIASRR